MEVRATIRRSIARALETPGEDTLSRWESLSARLDLASPIRTLSLPASARVVGVGGATLGGSGRTPVAIALAAALAARGVRVSVVAHGYRAKPGGARIVSPTCTLEEVGDEALLAARALEGRARVCIGKTRSDAIDYAARFSEVIIVDRLLQCRPTRLTRSLLAVDARAPWGSGRLFPFGDLVAARARLLSACDERVEVGSDQARSELAGVLYQGQTRPLASLSEARVGLVTSVARPRRVVASLAAHGVRPVMHVERSDHARSGSGERRDLERRARALGLDAWLLDAKSSIHLDLGAGGATLDHRVVLADGIVDRVVASC